MYIGNQAAGGNIDPLPGNCEVCVSFNAFVSQTKRNKGFGQQAHQERLEVARKHAYDYMICTVDLSNDVQLHTLEKYGWHKLDEFRSECTNHMVGIYGISLQAAAPQSPAPGVE